MTDPISQAFAHPSERAKAVASLREYGLPGQELRGAREWPGLMRMLDRMDASFRD